MKQDITLPIKRLNSLLSQTSGPADTAHSQPENTCPVCGAQAIQQKCKVICRSEVCVHRIIYNCSEF